MNASPSCPSSDPALSAALTAWKEASLWREKSFDSAILIRNSLRDTSSHRAFAWASLTCGRIASYRNEVTLAEVLLTEAVGRFTFLGDEYGKVLSEAHLAIPEISKQNLQHALQLALKPWSSAVEFCDADKHLLHNISAQAHWAVEDPYSALIHLIKSHELVRLTDSFDERSNVIANIGAVLFEVGETALGVKMSKEAWRIEQENHSSSRHVQLPPLMNIIAGCLDLDMIDEALTHATMAMQYSPDKAETRAPLMFFCLCETFALSGQLTNAQWCLDQQRLLSQGELDTPRSTSLLMLSEAVISSGKKDYEKAIEQAKEVLSQSLSEVTAAHHRFAARSLARSFAALGRKSEAAKWKKISLEVGREKFLGDFLPNQIRSSLSQIEFVDVTLTEQEMACLALSARGQTSADIAQKLGIKPRTVNFHFSKVLRKLNAVNRQEAIAKAFGANLLRR